MMADLTLQPDPTRLHLIQLEAAGNMITATVTTTAKDAQETFSYHTYVFGHSHVANL